MHVDLLFAGVDPVDASSAKRRFTFHTLAAGTTVLQAGAAGTSVLALIDGALEVRSGGVALATVHPGELVGELALFDASPRTADVVALVPSRVLEIPRAAYEELRDTAHPVAANLERVVTVQQASRLRQMDDRIAQLSRGGPRRSRLPGQDFFARVTAAFGRGGRFDPIGVDGAAAWRASGLMDDVPDQVLVELASRFAVRVCGSGHMLTTEGQPGDDLWLIEAGRVDVLVATDDDAVQVLSEVGPGALIGAAALVDGGSRTASCVATSRVVALQLDREGWDELGHDPTLLGSALRRAMIRALASQLAGANAMVERFVRDRDAEALTEAWSRLVSTRPHAERRMG